VPNEKGLFERSVEGVRVAGAPKENFRLALAVGFAASVADVAIVPLIDGGVPNENKGASVLQL
jgi:hypothetical protein